MQIHHILYLSLIFLGTSNGNSQQTIKEICHTENWMKVDLKRIQDDNDIKRLTADKCAVNLENLPSGRLTKILMDLMPRQSLKVLKVSGKLLGVDDESLSSLRSLKFLNLSNVDLGNSGDFGSGEWAKNIEALDLYGVGLINVTFFRTDSGKLKKLYMNKNKLQTVPSELKAFDNLQELSMKENKIKNFALKYTMINVEFLDLSHNFISNLSGLHNFPNVVVLNLTRNSISEMSVEFFEKERSNLQELYLDHNSLEFIPIRTLFNFHNLKVLSMKDNKLRKLIPTSDNYRYTKLEYLDLGENVLNDIPYNFMKWFPSLKILKLNNNKLTHLWISTFANLNKLEQLDLSINDIVEFNVRRLVPLESLSILDISHNKIEAFDYASLVLHNPSLKTVGLDGNSLFCEGLVEMLSVFDNNNITVEEGHCKHKEHIRSICCKDSDGNYTNMESRVQVMQHLLLKEEMEYTQTLRKMNEELIEMHKKVHEKYDELQDKNVTVTKAVFWTALGIVIVALILILVSIIVTSIMRSKEQKPVRI